MVVVDRCGPWVVVVTADEVVEVGRGFVVEVDGVGFVVVEARAPVDGEGAGPVVVVATTGDLVEIGELPGGAGRTVR